MPDPTPAPVRAAARTTAPLVHLVIGATGGIGAALARRLAGRGDRLVLCARRAGPLEDLAASLGALAIPLDARDFGAVDDAAARAAAEHGRLDGVANCAGSLLLAPAHRTSAEQLSETIAQNVGTALAAVRAAAGAMGDAGGSVVLFSSAAASVGLANHEAIAAAKGAVAALARAAAATYAPRRIRVNALAPALVRTPLSAKLVATPKALEASAAMHPLGRIGEAEEVAALAEWLLCGESSWVTGQTIGIDGGLAAVRGRGA